MPVALDAGSESLAAAEAVLPLPADMDDDQRARLSIDSVPIRSPRPSAKSAANIADVVTTAAKVTRYSGGVRAITVDGRAAQPRRQRIVGAGRGGASGLGYLRLLDDAGSVCRTRCGRSASGWPQTTTSS